MNPLPGFDPTVFTHHTANGVRLHCVRLHCVRVGQGAVVLL